MLSHLLLLCCSTVAATATTTTQPQAHSNGFSYGIQMDAGSSGTRLYVYKWDARVFTSIPPTITQVTTETSWNKKQRPGISSCANNPSDAGASIQPLLTFAIDTILKGEGVTDLSQVPVFLGATAGMRILPPSSVNAILKSVQSTIQKAGFMYNAEWIRVLSGEEEGAYGWIAANSLLGTLSGDSTNTVGALDLGGASTQSTFHPIESILADFFPLEIADISHQLYTHSYLYYGADQARYRMYDNLVSAGEAQAAQAAATGMKDPVTTVTNPCFPLGYSSRSDPNHPSIVFQGSSDWSSCLAAATKLIQDYQPLMPSSPNGVQCLHSDHERCTFNGVYQPKIQKGMTMLAMSGFFYNWNFFKLDTGLAQLSGDLETLEKNAALYCAQDAAGQAAYNNSLKHPQAAPFCYDYCFSAAYSYALMHTGYGLPVQNTPIKVVNDINGNDLGWAYGAMLYEINRLGWSYSPPSSDVDYSAPFFIALGCIVGLLFTSIALAVSFFKLKREQEQRGIGSSGDNNEYTQMAGESL